MDFKNIAIQNKILEVRVGSHLFGTDTPDSDLDLFGIFMPCEEIVYGFQKCNEVDLSVEDKDDTGRNTPDAIDRKFHEYRKFVKLALQNNPNILHVLFADKKNIVFCNDFGQALLDKAKLFPHKGAHARFIGYAKAQQHKMRIKPENYAKLERGLEVLTNAADATVMVELKDTYPFEYGGTGKHIRLGDLSIGTSTFVKRARKMVEERLSKASNRAELFTKYGYDVKFASNLIQLILEGIELMRTGWIEMPLSCSPFILAIKNGEYSVEQILAMAEDNIRIAREAYEKSTIPAEPRTKEIERFAINQVKEFLHEDRIHKFC